MIKGYYYRTDVINSNLNVLKKKKIIHINRLAEVVHCMLSRAPNTCSTRTYANPSFSRWLADILITFKGRNLVPQLNN